MLKFIAFLMMFFPFTISAAEYKFIIPNGPGTSSDTVARAVADEYHRQTGNLLILDYAPGGDQLVAVNKFKQEPKLAVILTSSTINWLNPLLRADLPYSDKDFTHVGFIGWSPNVWYTTPTSGIDSLQHLAAMIAAGRQIDIGVDAPSTQVNVLPLQAKLGRDKVQMVPYKGSSQTVTDVAGGHVPIGVSSLSPLIAATAAEGRIKIIGTTWPKGTVINDRLIPASDSALGVRQFNAAFMLSMSPVDSDEARKLARDLVRVINSDAVKTNLAKINITVDGGDGDYTRRIIQTHRTEIGKLLQR